MLWVEIEVNSSDPKHMVDPTWCVDEVDNTSAAGFHDTWWFWCHLQIDPILKGPKWREPSSRSDPGSYMDV